MSADTGAGRSPKRWLLPLSLASLLLVVALLMLFPGTWLNSGFVRQQLVRYAADEGIDLSYGSITAFSWWHGIAVDRLRLQLHGVTLACADLSYTPGHDMEVAKAAIRIRPDLLAAGHGSTSSYHQPLPPVLLTLIPKHVRVRQLDLSAPHLGYRGTLGMTLHGGMTIDTALQGRWHFQDRDQAFAGTMKTAFRFDLPGNRLDISRFELRQSDAQLSARDISVADLGDSPEVTAASFAAHCRVRPFATLVARWFPLPPRLQRIDVAGSHLGYSDNMMTMRLERLSLAGAQGSSLELSGPLKWSGQQGNRIGSSGLAFRLGIPDPATWGVPAAGAFRFDGKVRGSFDMDSDGAMSGQHLAMQGVYQAGDTRWNSDLSVESLRMHDHRLLLQGARVVARGEKPLAVAGLHVAAGEYRLLLADSRFDFEAPQRVGWHEDGEVDIAMQGLPPLALHVASQGVRERHDTVIDRLKINEKAQGVTATLRGRLHDNGPDQRTSRLRGTLSIGRLNRLGQWIDGMEGVRGKAMLSWSSRGLGRGELEMRGKLTLAGGALHRKGIVLRDVALELPFRQRLDMEHMALVRGRGINLADLSRIEAGALPGSLKVGALKAGGFSCDDLRLGLLYDEGVVSGKLEAGRLLDGNLSGYLQLTVPRHGRPYPATFARLALIHADTALLNPGRKPGESRLNLYGTVKSDGRSLSGRLSVPSIARQSMDDLIAWLDAKGEGAALGSVKRMMNEFGFTPSSVDARLQNRYADIDVVLHSRSGSEMKIPIHNLSVGHLMRR